MKYAVLILITVSTAILIIGGCSGSNDSESDLCDFNINSVTNGSNLNSVNSFWDCESTELGEFDFAIFEDGTGISPNIDEFIWEEIGCRSISFQTETLNANAADINLSNDFLTFILESDTPGLEESAVSCELVQL